MNEKEIFAKQLKDAKLKLGLNHNQFAELIGHSRDTYMAWYQGVNGCGEAKKEKILAILNEALSKKQ